VLFIGMLSVIYFIYSRFQVSADLKIKEAERKSDMKIEETERKSDMKIRDLQSQINESAENARKTREMDRNDFQASQASLNSRQNARINILEAEIAVLTKDCDTLRIGCLTFQREIQELNLTIEKLRGENHLNSVRYTATIDSLQQEVETLRKQLKEQKKKHDSDMEAMQNEYDELKEKLSQKLNSSLGAFAFALRQNGEGDEKVVIMRPQQRELQEGSHFDDIVTDKVVKPDSVSKHLGT
jgi:chromosome segregation ATPase